MRTRIRLLTLAVAATTILAACAGSDDPAADASTDDSATAGAATTDGAATADATEAATTGEAATADATEAATIAAEAAEAFPVTVEHMFGEATIEEAPERIVTVGSREHELLYALGIAPVAVPEHYVGYDYATGPWAEEARLAVGAEPEVFPSGELNVELIASYEPDLIVGTYSGMTEDQYAQLSGIAPTLAQGGDYPAYGMPLDAELELIGQATGTSEVAARVTEEIDAAFTAVRDAHPDWEGKTASTGFHYDGNPGIYHSSDNRNQFLARLGLEVSALDDNLNDEFYISISSEQLDLLDAFDALVWQAGSDNGVRDTIEGLPLYDSLELTERGGHLWIMSPDLEAAFFANSPSSIMYSLDALEPQLEAALDGDPSTEVPAFDPAA